MLRYIKVNDIWVDTLAAQRDLHLVYMIIEGKVITIDDDCNETYIGEIQDERMSLPLL